MGRGGGACAHVCASAQTLGDPFMCAHESKLCDDQVHLFLIHSDKRVGGSEKFLLLFLKVAKVQQKKIVFKNHIWQKLVPFSLLYANDLVRGAFSNRIFLRVCPTTNGGMQNGSPVGIVGTYSHCMHIFARLVLICMLSR